MGKNKKKKAAANNKKSENSKANERHFTQNHRGARPKVAEKPPRMERKRRKQTQEPFNQQESSQNKESEFQNPIPTLPPTDLGMVKDQKSYSEVVQKDLIKVKPVEISQVNVDENIQSSQPSVSSTNAEPAMVKYTTPTVPSISGMGSMYMLRYQPPFCPTMYKQPIPRFNYISQPVNPFVIHNYPQQMIITDSNGKPTLINISYSPQTNNFVHTQPVTSSAGSIAFNTNFLPSQQTNVLHNISRLQQYCNVASDACLQYSYNSQQTIDANNIIQQRTLHNTVDIQPVTEAVSTDHTHDIPTFSFNGNANNVITKTAQTMTYSPLFSVVNCNSFPIICHNTICSYNGENPYELSQLSPITKPYMTLPLLGTICVHYGKILPVIPMFPCCFKVYNNFACPKCKFCIEFMRGIISEFNTMKDIPQGNFRIATLYDILTKSASICSIANLLTSRDSLIPYKYEYLHDDLKEQPWLQDLQRLLITFLLDQDKYHHNREHYAFIIVILSSRIGKIPIYELLRQNIFNANESVLNLVTLNQRIMGVDKAIRIESYQKCIAYMKLNVDLDSNSRFVDEMNRVLDN